MRTVDEILDSIKKAKNLQRDADLARYFGVGPSTVATWRKRNTVPFEQIVALCEKEGISLDWLLSGTGPRERGRAHMTDERAGHRTGPLYDSNQMKEAIMAAEEYLREIKKDLAPKDKAELITKLYQIAMESAGEETPEAARRKASRMALELARYAA